jgi:hypothetical protein
MDADKPLHMLYVEWKDSCSEHCGATSEEMAMRIELPIVRQLGYFLGIRDDKLYLAQECLEGSVRDVSVIPCSSISKIITLKLGKDTSLDSLGKHHS